MLRLSVMATVVALSAASAEGVAKVGATPPVEAATRPRLFVTELIALGVTPAQAQAFGDAVVSALSSRGLFELVAARDVQTLLGVERQKTLLGLCEANPEQCAKDAQESLSARFVLSGQLARVGSAYQLTLQMVDTQKGQSVARATKLSGSLDELRALVPYAAAEATGSPLPPPPSRVVPYSLVAAGGVAAFTGGVVGLLAVSRQQVLNDELCPGGAPAAGPCSGVNLRDRSFYVAQDSDIAQQKALAVGLLATGAVLAGLGLWLNPPATSVGGVALQVVPGPGGVALAGGF